MNPPDANYWLALASQWIQNQAQINFPTNFPQQNPNPQYTAHPNALNNDATSNDNCIEADMEIEDEEPVNQNFSSWQTNSEPAVVHKLPSTIYSITPSSPASKISSSTGVSYPKFVKIPLAPVISQISTETSNDAGDMVLDSDEDDSPSSAEAQKRKKLPLWIREGLERMERTKKQEALRLQKEKEIQKEEESRKRILQDALMELENEKQSKSKYDSESEEDSAIEETKTDSAGINDDEDAFEKMMLLVRKTLTEIFLEVTDEKIQEISKSTLEKYRQKASSVTKVTNIIGLGVYGSDEDSDSDGKNDDHSDWETESILKERIRIKTNSFEHRAKKIRDDIAKEEEAEKEQLASEANEQHKSKASDDYERNRKNIFEETNSTLTSSVASGRQRDKKKSRFSDPKDRTSGVLVTHVGLTALPNLGTDNGSTLPQLFHPSVKAPRSSSSSSSSSGRHKKHSKRHKKSSKHSKKSSKRRSKSPKHKSSKSDRRSMESRSSVRSSDSRRHRSRSRSHDRHKRSTRRY